jgi:CheY-like chemotaxis protein
MGSVQMLSELHFLANVPPGPPFRRNASGQHSSQKQRPTVLIADDEELIADTLAEILNDSGFDAVAVYDGTSALEQVRESCPDVLIADVVMPGMNGVELAINVRDRCSSTRVLLLSGQAATLQMLDRAKAEGYSFELLAKPLHPDLLLKKLKE